MGIIAENRYQIVARARKEKLGRHFAQKGNVLLMEPIAG